MEWAKIASPELWCLLCNRMKKGVSIWRKFINRLALAWLNTEDGVKCRLVFPCKNWSFHLRKLKFGTLQIVVFNCQNSFIIEIRQFFCCAKANRFMNFRHRGGVGKWRFRAIRTRIGRALPSSWLSCGSCASARRSPRWRCRARLCVWSIREV